MRLLKYNLSKKKINFYQRIRKDSITKIELSALTVAIFGMLNDKPTWSDWWVVCKYVEDLRRRA